MQSFKKIYLFSLYIQNNALVILVLFNVKIIKIEKVLTINKFQMQISIYYSGKFKT